VHQLKGERSYHIFFQLVRGTKDKTQREALRLPGKPSDFAYLATSGCTVRTSTQGSSSSSRGSSSGKVRSCHLSVMSGRTHALFDLVHLSVQHLRLLRHPKSASCPGVNAHPHS
jgi:hypothetical protein